MNLEDDSTLETVDMNNGESTGTAVPGWGIGLIVIACALAVIQVVYITYRVRHDMEAHYSERI